jgi:hypothetical protein
MDRISLLRGIDSAGARERVDILVPDGTVEAAAPGRSTLGLAIDLSAGPPAPQGLDDLLQPGGRKLAVEAADDPRRLPLQGAARIDLRNGLTGRMVCVGAAEDGVRALGRFIARFPGAAAPLAETAAQLQRVRFGTGTLSPADIRRVANEVLDRTVAHRAGGATRPVVTLAGAPPAQIAALSVRCWVGRDPFAMVPDQSTGFNASVQLFIPAVNAISVSLELDGQLTRGEAREGQLGPEIALHVRSGIELETSGIEIDQDPTRFDADLVLFRGRVQGRDALGLRDQATSWLAFALWSGDPVVVDGALEVRGPAQPGRPALGGPLRQASAAPGIETPELFPPPEPGRSRVLATLHGVEDATINQPGNQHHEAAVSGLLILAGMHPEDPTYHERGIAELFPEQAAPVGEIRATTDWALFRRRRSEECDGSPVTAPPPGRVAARLVKAATAEEAKQFADQLRGTAGNRVPLKSAGDLEFAADAATLLTSPGLWRQHYQVAGGGELVRFAGYAAAAGTSGQVVGVSRAQAAVAALGTVAGLDPEGAVDLVTSPPSGEMVPGTEGTIFLVTYGRPTDPVEVDCVEVLAVDVSGKAAEDLAKALRSGDQAAVATLEKDSTRITTVDKVTFPGADPDRKSLEEVDKQLKDQREAYQANNDPRDTTGVGWVNKEWSDAGHKGGKDHLTRLGQELKAAVAAADVATVDYKRKDGCPARLYVLFTPPTFE